MRALFLLLLFTVPVRSDAQSNSDRHRVVVLTDIENEPDDTQHF